MYIPEFNLEECGFGISEPDAYTVGWFTGDGFMDGDKQLVVVQKSEYETILPKIRGKAYKEQQKLICLT